MRDYSIGVLGVSTYEPHFRALERKARADVRGATLSRFADLRYAGQSYELTIPWGDDFHREHQRVYGYSDAKRPTQVVTLRLRATIPVKPPDLRSKRKVESVARRVWVGGRWRQLTTQATRGPALIADYGSTTLVPPRWTIRTDSAGTLVLRR